MIAPQASHPRDAILDLLKAGLEALCCDEVRIQEDPVRRSLSIRTRRGSHWVGYCLDELAVHQTSSHASLIFEVCRSIDAAHNHYHGRWGRSIMDHPETRRLQRERSQRLRRAVDDEYIRTHPSWLDESRDAIRDAGERAMRHMREVDEQLIRSFSPSRADPEGPAPPFTLERLREAVREAYVVPRSIMGVDPARPDSDESLISGFREFLSTWELGQEYPTDQCDLPPDPPAPLERGIPEPPPPTAEEHALADALYVEGLPEVDILTPIGDDDLVERFREDYDELFVAAEAHPSSKPLGEKNPNLPVYRPI